MFLRDKLAEIMELKIMSGIDIGWTVDTVVGRNRKLEFPACPDTTPRLSPLVTTVTRPGLYITPNIFSTTGVIL